MTAPEDGDEGDVSSEASGSDPSENTRTVTTTADPAPIDCIGGNLKPSAGHSASTDGPELSFSGSASPFH